jgi:hypothetical protein
MEGHGGELVMVVGRGLRRGVVGKEPHEMRREKRQLFGIYPALDNYTRVFSNVKIFTNAAQLVVLL